MTGGTPSSTLAARMHTLGRVALLLLVTITLVAAGIPPALDEDRSVPGFCSPDCPLQQDATHSLAVAPPPPCRDWTVQATGERPSVAPARVVPVTAASPDAPRAPPLA